MVVKNAHALAGHTGITRHSPRNGSRIISCSPRCSGRFGHRPLVDTPRSLTPASGCQDHTSSPSASDALVRSIISVHRILPRVRDDLEPPSSGTGRDKYRGDFRFGKSEYFFKQHWTAQIKLIYLK